MKKVDEHKRDIVYTNKSTSGMYHSSLLCYFDFRFGEFARIPSRRQGIERV